MKTLAISFTALMIQAIQEGRKTMTRRLPNPRVIYQVGDRLVVREAWQTEERFDHLKPSELPAEATVYFQADGANFIPRGEGRRPGKFRASRFMPYRFSRLTLEVVEVRDEPVQGISESDAMEEGAGVILCDHEYWDGDPDQYRKCFQAIWDRIHGEEIDGCWEANPTLRVIGFKVVTA